MAPDDSAQSPGAGSVAGIALRQCRASLTTVRARPDNCPWRSRQSTSPARPRPGRARTNRSSASASTSPTTCCWSNTGPAGLARAADRPLRPAVARSRRRRCCTTARRCSRASRPSATPTAASRCSASTTTLQPHGQRRPAPVDAGARRRQSLEEAMLALVAADKRLGAVAARHRALPASDAHRHRAVPRRAPVDALPALRDHLAGRRLLRRPASSR